MINLSEHFGVIKISGDDASAFLQNQFSNDIALVNNETSQISSYNSPKGRVYAVLRIIQTDTGYLLITTQSQINFLIKRLSMFVLRSDVAISDLTSDYSLYGVEAEYLNKHDIPYNNASNSVSAYDEAFIMCVLGNDERYMLLAKQDAVIPDSSAQQQNLQDWLRADIQAGMPHIYPETQEAFVAQMLNLDIIDGINFQKGCYPGQEIVARMKYLGTLKKRMFAISFDAANAIVPGQALYSEDSNQSIGQIVYSSQHGKQYAALAVLNIEIVDSNKKLFLDQEKQQTIKIERRFV